MKKDEFYIKLANSLQDVSLDEQQKVLDYYEELISDRMDSGMSEEEAVASLGDPEKLAKEALADIVQKQELPPLEIEKIPARQTSDTPKKPQPQVQPKQKKKRVWLRVLITLAIVFTVLGCLAAAPGYFYIHSTRVGRSIHLTEDIQQVIFDSESGDLRIIEDDYRAGTVEFTENALSGFQIRQANGTVFIDQETPLDFIELGEAVCTVYVPERMLESVKAETSSGDVFLQVLKISTVGIETSSGDVEIRCKTEELNVRTSSGDIELGGIYHNATLKTFSGDVELDRCVGTSLSIETRSGEVEGEYGAAADTCEFDVRTSSGEIEVPRGAKGIHKVIVRTTSGDVEIDCIP